MDVKLFALEHDKFQTLAYHLIAMLIWVNSKLFLVSNQSASKLEWETSLSLMFVCWLLQCFYLYTEYNNYILYMIWRMVFFDMPIFTN